jgi:hypothetical protein
MGTSPFLKQQTLLALSLANSKTQPEAVKKSTHLAKALGRKEEQLELF